MKTVFDTVKKQNGLSFAKTLREKDSGLFDIPNLPEIVKYAGRDAKPLLLYLNSLKNIQIVETARSEESWNQLLERAGYDAYLADTHEKHISISKYYQPHERICFFDDPERSKKYYIINAVKKDAGKIMREDLPHREDPYGTSVISIHILKKGGFICITNRYNHTVQNPDNSFGSNPDNIIPGLACAIKRDFAVDFSSQAAEIPEGFVIAGKKLIKYNYELNGIYFGASVWVKDGEITELPGHRTILDYFVFNQKTKRLENLTNIEDAFTQAFANELAGKKFQIAATGKTSRRLNIAGGGHIETNDGKITSVRLLASDRIGDNFLRLNDSLTSASLPNAREIGNNFLSDNTVMMDPPHLPSVEKIGLGFIRRNPYAGDKKYNIGREQPVTLSYAVRAMAKSIRAAASISAKLFDLHPRLYGMFVRYSYDQCFVQWPFLGDAAEAGNFIKNILNSILTIEHFSFFLEQKIFREDIPKDTLKNKLLNLIDAGAMELRESGDEDELSSFIKGISRLPSWILTGAAEADEDELRVIKKFFEISDVLGPDGFSTALVNMTHGQVKLFLSQADFSHPDTAAFLSHLAERHKTKEVFDFVFERSPVLACRYMPGYAQFQTILLVRANSVREKLSLALGKILALGSQNIRG